MASKKLIIDDKDIPILKNALKRYSRTMQNGICDLEEGALVRRLKANKERADNLFEKLTTLEK